ncbi:MAG: hypothetical protein R3F59_25050 [Myxococcota bacterium]
MFAPQQQHRPLRAAHPLRGGLRRPVRRGPGYDDYIGAYYAAETIKRDNDRVDITKLPTTISSGPTVTGGYIFKEDRPGPNESGFWAAAPAASSSTSSPSSTSSRTRRPSRPSSRPASWA